MTIRMYIWVIFCLCTTLLCGCSFKKSNFIFDFDTGTKVEADSFEFSNICKTTKKINIKAINFGDFFRIEGNCCSIFFGKDLKSGNLIFGLFAIELKRNNKKGKFYVLNNNETPGILDCASDKDNIYFKINFLNFWGHYLARWDGISENICYTNDLHNYMNTFRIDDRKIFIIMTIRDDAEYYKKISKLSKKWPKKNIDSVTGALGDLYIYNQKSKKLKIVERSVFHYLNIYNHNPYYFNKNRDLIFYNLEKDEKKIVGHFSDYHADTKISVLDRDKILLIDMGDQGHISIYHTDTKKTEIIFKKKIYRFYKIDADNLLFTKNNEVFLYNISKRAMLSYMLTDGKRIGYADKDYILYWKPDSQVNEIEIKDTRFEISRMFKGTSGGNKK